MIKNWYLLVLFSMFILFFIACSPQPEPINYETDICAYCKMSISDTQFGAELVTKKGKVYKFDSIECLINFMSEEKDVASQKKFLLTVDYSSPTKLINVEESFYVQTDSISSPMGANILSFEQKSEAEKIVSKYNGKLMRWNEVVNYVLSLND
ncbi:MAG: hypothetical protein OHK0036_01910 [Bacteroidia bacterium]